MRRKREKYEQRGWVEGERYGSEGEGANEKEARLGKSDDSPVWHSSPDATQMVAVNSDTTPGLSPITPITVMYIIMQCKPL